MRDVDDESVREVLSEFFSRAVAKCPGDIVGFAQAAVASPLISRTFDSNPVQGAAGDAPTNITDSAVLHANCQRLIARGFDHH